MASAAHRHDDHHTHAPAAQGGRFALAFALTVGILVVEVVAGLAANSLALLSDAGHIITDVFALGLGWYAAMQASRPTNARKSFGYHRAGIIAAFVNALTLLGVTAWIIVAAAGRLRQPEHVSPPLMIGAALLAVAANLVIARFLAHGHSHSDLNTRAALLHVVGDVAASAGVVAGALAILLTGNPVIDPLISIGIAILIAVGAVRVGRAALDVLLEATPSDIDTAQVEASLRKLRGIHDIHHLHVWGITDTMRVLSCHAIVEDVPLSATAPLLARMNDVLRKEYGIEHATIQFEDHQHQTGVCTCSAPGDCACSMEPPATASAHHH